MAFRWWADDDPFYTLLLSAEAAFFIHMNFTIITYSIQVKKKQLVCYCPGYCRIKQSTKCFYDMPIHWCITFFITCIILMRKVFILNTFSFELAIVIVSEQYIIASFIWILSPSLINEKNVRVGPLLIKLSGTAHDMHHFFYISRGCTP